MVTWLHAKKAHNCSKCYKGYVSGPSVTITIFSLANAQYSTSNAYFCCLPKINTNWFATRTHYPINFSQIHLFDTISNLEFPKSLCAITCTFFVTKTALKVYMLANAIP